MQNTIQGRAKLEEDARRIERKAVAREAQQSPPSTLTPAEVRVPMSPQPRPQPQPVVQNEDSPGHLKEDRGSEAQGEPGNKSVRVTEESVTREHSVIPASSTTAGPSAIGRDGTQRGIILNIALGIST